MSTANFKETVFPLNQFLINSGFLIREIFDYCIEFYSHSVTIRLVFDWRIQLFEVYVGQTQDSLAELTPEAINKIFDEPRFLLQSTLTINDLISFFSNKGNVILKGDANKLRELKVFSKTTAVAYNENLILKQNLKQLDNAWNQMDYHSFIKAFKETNQNLLPNSYFKKYEIAKGKIK
jgi:hypothetical protein